MRRQSLEERSSGSLLGSNDKDASEERRTADDVGRGTSVSFLHTVQLVQRQQRMAKLLKAKSTRGFYASSRDHEFTSHGPNGVASMSERTPLTGTDLIYQNKSEDFSEDLGKINEEGLEGKEEPYSLKEAFLNIFFGMGVVSFCLLATPFALMAVFRDWGATWVFGLNFVVMIPLASILGAFTEEVALHTNQTIGGLINASFGNAVEVVVAIQALLADEIRVVQASMLGSIFSNLLLVLGSCFFFGGLYHKEQSFNPQAATANMGLLALSSIALVLPTPFAEYYNIQDEHVLLVSRFSAVFLLFMYIQLLVFQLKTHVHLFDDGDSAGELAQMPFWVACVGLLVTTLLITIFSAFLVQSITGFTEETGVSHTFVGLILLPIVGNAVEHVTAVTVAVKDKMDLAMGIAVGSCTQISLFVVPLTVLVGWATDKNMTLNFPHFEIALFVLSIMTVSIIISNPTSNWLEGSLLISVYCMISIAFWFESVVNF